MMANVIALWAWAAVGLKARLKAAATKPAFAGWMGRLRPTNTAERHTEPACAGAARR